MEEKLLTILKKNDDSDFKEFCLFAKNGLLEKKIIRDLADNYETTLSYKYLKKLSWLYFVELQGRHFGEEVHFEVSSFSESFQEYLYSWDRLGRKGIPQDKWADFIEEGIELLKVLIDENKLEEFREDHRYQDFMKRFIQRHEDLRLSGEYPDLNELMDD